MNNEAKFIIVGFLRFGIFCDIRYFELKRLGYIPCIIAGKIKQMVVIRRQKYCRQKFSIAFGNFVILLLFLWGTHIGDYCQLSL